MYVRPIPSSFFSPVPFLSIDKKGEQSLTFSPVIEETQTRSQNLLPFVPFGRQKRERNLKKFPLWYYLTSMMMRPHALKNCVIWKLFLLTPLWYIFPKNRLFEAKKFISFFLQTICKRNVHSTSNISVTVCFDCKKQWKIVIGYCYFFALKQNKKLRFYTSWKILVAL